MDIVKDAAGKIKHRLQEEDIAEMDITTLQHHLSNIREAIAELYLGIKQKTRDEVSLSDDKSRFSLTYPAKRRSEKKETLLCHSILT